MTRHSFRSSTSSPARTAPISLDDLAHRIAELWALEPAVPPARRTELLSRLGELESEVDGLLLRSAAGTEAHPASVRRCAQQLLWLRDEWGHDEVAA